MRKNLTKDDIEKNAEELLKKAQHYNNFILVSGYAGYFGLWQITKEFLIKELVLFSSLLVLVSLTIFIVWEIVKMKHLSDFAIKVSDITKNHPIYNYNDEYEAILVEDRNFQLNYIRVWKWVFRISTITGLGGVSILMLAIVHEMIFNL